ncbi:unnamed protein product [Pleuronectes platessa]|uniref:Uncharacterized protein n=1 Tax=Pleuronectes platessa TaxID=8262 RepID=A0A9N7V8A8_PLEPL|nr:unnamed protein product [Pleuronectes platessa]
MERGEEVKRIRGRWEAKRAARSVRLTVSEERGERSREHRGAPTYRAAFIAMMWVTDEGFLSGSSSHKLPSIPAMLCEQMNHSITIEDTASRFIYITMRVPFTA